MKTYEEVADFYGLKGKRKELYVRYMRERWPDTEALKVRTGYAHEWAERFKDGVEFLASDSDGKKILYRLSREVYSHE